MTEKDYEYMVAGNYNGAVYTNDRPTYCGAYRRAASCSWNNQHCLAFDNLYDSS